MKNEAVERADKSTEPVIKDKSRKVKDCLSFAVLATTKYRKTEKSGGTKAVNESALFSANILDKSTAAAKRTKGKSKGVLLKITLPIASVFAPKRRRDRETTTPIRICLGRVKASVVRVEKTRGITRKVSPKRKVVMFCR